MEPHLPLVCLIYNNIPILYVHIFSLIQDKTHSHLVLKLSCPDFVCFFLIVACNTFFFSTNINKKEKLVNTSSDITIFDKYMFLKQPPYSDYASLVIQQCNPAMQSLSCCELKFIWSHIQWLVMFFVPIRSYFFI